MTRVHRVATPAPMRLVDYARAHLIVVPVPAVGELVARGRLRVDGHPSTTRDRVAAGDELALSAGDLAATGPLAAQPIDLLCHHEDDDLLVVDKPAGMHVHPLGAHRADTLLNALLWRAGARPDEPWGAWRPAAAHRLDRAASGLLLVAKHAAAHDALRRQFATDAITRRYVAWVVGTPAEAGTIDAPLGRDPAAPYRRAVVADGQPALTRWRRVAQRGPHAELAVEIATGRTHQIRAHLASVGLPIVGDTLYAAATPGPAGADSAPRIALHATELVFTHPRTGATITCRSPAPR